MQFICRGCFKEVLKLRAGKLWCPKCGFAPEKREEIAVAEGELQLVGRTKKEQLSRENKQDVYSQLIAIKEKHGYSDGWLSHKYREIFGVWPNSLEYSAKEPTQDVNNWVKYQRIKYAKSQATR